MEGFLNVSFAQPAHARILKLIHANARSTARVWVVVGLSSARTVAVCFDLAVGFLGHVTQAVDGVVDIRHAPSAGAQLAIEGGVVYRDADGTILLGDYNDRRACLSLVDSVNPPGFHERPQLFSYSLKQATRNAAVFLRRGLSAGSVLEAGSMLLVPLREFSYEMLLCDSHALQERVHGAGVWPGVLAIYGGYMLGRGSRRQHGFIRHGLGHAYRVLRFVVDVFVLGLLLLVWWLAGGVHDGVRDVLQLFHGRRVQQQLGRRVVGAAAQRIPQSVDAFTVDAEAQKLAVVAHLHRAVR